MNNDKADKLKPYNYFLFRVRKPEWSEDYVEPDEPVNPDEEELYVNRLKSDGYNYLQLHIDNYTPSIDDNAPTFTFYDNEGGVGGFTSILTVFKEQTSSIHYNESKIFANFDLDNVDTDAQKIDIETNSPEDVKPVYAILDPDNSNKINIYYNSEEAASGATEYVDMSFELVDGNKVIYTILDHDFTQTKYMNFHIEFYY